MSNRFCLLRGVVASYGRQIGSFFVLGFFVIFLSSLYTSLFSTWNNKKQASNSQLTTHGSTRNLAKLQTPMRLDGREVFSSSVLSISEGGTRGLCYKSWFIWFNPLKCEQCGKMPKNRINSSRIMGIRPLKCAEISPPPPKKKNT